MNITIERQRIKEQLDNVSDENILNAIKKILGIQGNKYLPKLTKEDMINRAVESEKAIAEERFSTIEQLEEEMKNW
jgi:ribosomal protein S10